MKRTDLIALAERLEPMAAAPVFDGIDVAALADFLRQIAESQPVAWKATALSLAVGQDLVDEMTDDQRRHYPIPLYTLPLED